MGRQCGEAPTVLGGVTSDEEEEQLEALQDWVEAQGPPRGVVSFDFANPGAGEQRAVFDLAWPQGPQEALSQPAAVPLHEDAPMVAVASQAGDRCLTAVADFKADVRAEVLAEAGSSGAAFWGAAGGRPSGAGSGY